MKLLLILLVLFLFINNCNCKLYINLVPYSTIDCSGKSNGSGYGITENTCFSLDNYINWLIKKEENSILISGYKYNEINPSESELCTLSKPTIPTENYKINSCIQGNKIEFIKSNSEIISKFSSKTYYKLTVTKDEPYTPLNEPSLITSYQYGECEIEANSILVQYYTNGTFIYDESNDNESSILLYCSKDGPVGKSCLIDGSYCYPETMYLNQTCVQRSPFFNSSSDLPEPTTTGGPWTDHATTHIYEVDGNSGTSGSSSGTGIGYNNDKLIGSGTASSSGGSGSGSSSSLSQNYYQSSYCSTNNKKQTINLN